MPVPLGVELGTGVAREFCVWEEGYLFGGKNTAHIYERGGVHVGKNAPTLSYPPSHIPKMKKLEL